MTGIDDWDELGPPELRPMPDGKWAARRGLVVGALIVAGLLLVAVGVWAVVRSNRPAPVSHAPAGEATKPATVTESFTVTATGPASSTVVTMTPGTTSTVPVGPKTYERAQRVAFRRDGALWVSDEAGRDEQKVATSSAGAFALSPDGGTLALVDAAAKSLVVVDVAASKATTVGPADVRMPVWSPSSGWLAFTNGTEVRRVDREGMRMKYLGTGTRVAIGPDDASFAFAATDGRIVVTGAKGGTKDFRVKGRVDAIALGASRVFYSVGGSSRADLALHSAAPDGTGDLVVAGAPSDQDAGRYDELQLSPDGKWLTYAIAGDDMHSRLRAMRTDGTHDKALSMRRDDYLLEWSADGSRVLFIDGNVLQGEPTRLMSVLPDGTKRTILLEGAGF